MQLSEVGYMFRVAVTVKYASVGSDPQRSRTPPKIHELYTGLLHYEHSAAPCSHRCRFLAHSVQTHVKPYGELLLPIFIILKSGDAFSPFHRDLCKVLL
jgi:hypothetical protein